jgi:hypothetical protein
MRCSPELHKRFAFQYLYQIDMITSILAARVRDLAVGAIVCGNCPCFVLDEPCSELTSIAAEPCSKQTTDFTRMHNETLGQGFRVAIVELATGAGEHPLYVPKQWLKLSAKDILGSSEFELCIVTAVNLSFV